MTNKIVQYHLSKGNKNAAMHILAAYFRQNEPHQKDIRRKRRIETLVTKLRTFRF